MVGSPGWCSSRDQLPAIVPDQRDLDDDAGLDRRIEANFREMLGATAVARFHQHASRCSDLGVEMAGERRRALLAQAPRALLDGGAIDLRHARRRRAWARRERKDV